MMSAALLSRRAVLLGAATALLQTRAQAGEAERIVSIGGAVTEILYRLGHGADIVGVDTTSQYPVEALKTKKSVGYLRALGAEGILSLMPTLVIASDGAGPPDVLKILEQSGTRLITIPEEHSAEGVLRRIERVAEVVGEKERGGDLCRSIRAEFSQLADMRGRLTKPVRALFVLSLQNGRPLVGGSGTTADAIIDLAGARNAVASFNGWKPLSDEGIIAAAPDVVIMMNRGTGEAPGDPFALPAFLQSPAAKERRAVVMDGLYLLGFGPRTASAARDLMKALYPDVA
jgi:iron complex transport system substrate-binding protein